MALDPALPRRIQQALARGWTVVTANQRAARTLLRAYDLQQQALGHAAWQPPHVLAWDTWLAAQWRRLLLEGHASALLLNRTQEHALWASIIEADRDSVPIGLTNVDSLAELAADAWRLLHAYQSRRGLAAAADTVDTRAFARWAAAFLRRADRAGYLTAAQLPEALRDACVDGRLLSPGLLLVGFDAKTPAEAALLRAVELGGAEVEEFTLPPYEGQHTLVTAKDKAEEIATAATWARDLLIAAPTARLAVIVPDLEADRARIERVFRGILAPELHDIAAPGTTGPFEFSLGVPLAHTGLAAAALDILRWTVGPLPLDDISALLVSPYFAAAPGEHLARAEFDAYVLRRQPLLQPHLSLAALYELVARPTAASSLPVLQQYLHALGMLLDDRDLAIDRTHADWAAIFHDLLHAVGWGASSRDTSVEFQTRRKWESALDELATLDFDGQRIACTAALGSLERIATQTLFAPESHHAPIQIMGPLESAGSTFDGLWFLGAGDLSWPAAPRPNPLLPWLLQRDLAMPGTDPTADAARAERITHRIAASAPACLFSYASESADAQQRPSSTLEHLALASIRADELMSPSDAADPVALEVLEDTAPIPPPPDAVLRGGAGILQAQAACGFRAFAEKRLFATSLDSTGLGLDAGERGSLVHTVLERFWTEVQSQEALRSLTAAERDAILEDAIGHALHRQTQAIVSAWDEAYLDTERRRLSNLLRAWLDFELTRPPFTVAAREETLKDVQIGPLRLSIRIDRIDRTADGGEIILDYKTGAARPAEWLGERPDAPQLPLYAVLSHAEHLAAVGFASVRAGKDMGLTGYEDVPGILPKASRLPAASLDAQREAWYGILTALATSFHSGDAAVSPKQYPATCRTCRQRLLCRLDAATLGAIALDDAESSEREADLG